MFLHGIHIFLSLYMEWDFCIFRQVIISFIGMKQINFINVFPKNILFAIIWRITYKEAAQKNQRPRWSVDLSGQVYLWWAHGERLTHRVSLLPWNGGVEIGKNDVNGEDKYQFQRGRMEERIWDVIKKNSEVLTTLIVNVTSYVY